jgi:hypothetical protein
MASTRTRWKSRQTEWHMFGTTCVSAMTSFTAATGGGFAEVHSVESSGCTPLLPPCVRSRHADITLHKLPGEMSLDRDALLVRGPALLHELGAAWRLLVAWVINLFVLACSSLFLACIASSPQQTSNSAFTQAAARGYGVSLALTFLVKDPLVAAFIAILPARSVTSNPHCQAFVGALTKVADFLAA